MTSTRHWRWLVGIVLVAGMVLRLRGLIVLSPPFWSDEASWALRILEKSEYYAHRPFGYAYLLKGLASLFGPYEVVLRAPSFVASLISAPLLTWIAFFLSRSMVCALFVAWLTAVSPEILSYAQEAKPYSLDLALHAMVLALSLKVFSETQRRESRWMWALLILIPVAICFAYNIVLIAAPLYAALLFRTRRPVRVKLGIVFSGLLAATILLFALLRVFTAYSANFAPEYWGNRYDVFFVGTSAWQRLSWLLSKQIQLLQWPFQFPIRSGEVLIAWIGLIFFLIGLGTLVRRRALPALFLLLSPLAGMVFLNLLGKWPLGPFRTNLFTFAYLLPVASLPLAWNPGCVQRVRFSISPVLVVAGLMAVVVTPQLNYRKYEWTSRIYYTAVRRFIDQVSLTFDRPVKIYAPSFPEFHLMKYYGAIHPRTAIWQVSWNQVFDCGRQRDCAPARNLIFSDEPVAVLLQNPPPAVPSAWKGKRIAGTKFWMWYYLGSREPKRFLSTAP